MSWWESDPRYGKPGWTLIHGDGPSRFVFNEPKPRRAPSTNIRFADLQPGAVLIHRGKTTSVKFEHSDRLQAKGRTLSFANDDAKEVTTVHRYVGLALVTDRWFDPVLGEDDPLKGQLAAIVAVGNNGIVPNKRAHTLRGLASQGYDWATPEQSARVHAFINERKELTREWIAGRLTGELAVLRATSWRTLMRELGLEP